MDIFCSHHKISSSTIYQEEGAYKELWCRLLDDRQENLKCLREPISSLFSKVVVPGGRIIISQYPSYIERILEQVDAVQFCKDLLCSVVEELCEHDFESESSIIESTLGDSSFPFRAEECFLLKKKSL